MLLIGAVAMAVLFVSLSIVLNGGVYTRTMAADASADVAVGETNAIQDAVRRDVAGNMTTAHALYPDDYAEQEEMVSEGVEALGEGYARYYARRDAIVDVSFNDTTEGRYVHKGSGDFEYSGGPYSGAENWQLARNSRVREFALTVYRGGLDTSSGDPFTVVVDEDGTLGSGDEWTIRMYQNGGASGTTHVEVDPPSGPATECTDPDGTSTRIDVTGASVAGEFCNPLDFFERLEPPYSVRFENADQVSGSYGLIAKSTSTGIPGTTNVRGHNPEDRLYSTTADLTVRTTDVNYTAPVRVAPGEPA